MIATRVYKKFDHMVRVVDRHASCSLESVADDDA